MKGLVLEVRFCHQGAPWAMEEEFDIALEGLAYSEQGPEVLDVERDLHNAICR